MAVMQICIVNACTRLRVCDLAWYPSNAAQFQLTNPRRVRQMVNIINQGTLGGGFRHYQGLVPVQRGSGDTHHAAVKNFHVAVTNAVAMFRGDIITYADASHGVQGGGAILYG